MPSEKKHQEKETQKLPDSRERTTEDVSPGVSTDLWRPGTVLLNDYVVKKRIDIGGMGAVFLVHRKLDDEPFAVKTLRAQTGVDLLHERNFLQELRTWIDLPHHPNLTACRFFRTLHNRLYVFSEFVNGGSLKDAIRKQRILSLDKILDVAIQAAWGLEAAHRCRVIHQDIKPGNILLSRKGEVKVTDFGLARAIQTGNVDTEIPGCNDSGFVKTLGLSYQYCSPEQARSEQLTHTTDI